MAPAVGFLGIAGVLIAGLAGVLFANVVLDSIAHAGLASVTSRRIDQSSFLGIPAVADAAKLDTRGRLVRRFLIVDSLVFAAVWILARNPLPATVLSAGALVFGYFWLQTSAENRLEKMRTQLPDAFALVGNSLASGLSLVQALAYAAAETPEPLGPYLFGLVNDVAAGIDLSESLVRFRASVPLRELQMISTAMEIQHRVGGNIREMLEQATQSIRQSLALRLSLRAQTAQGRLSSKVVGLMPLGLVIVLSLMMEGYLETFFGTPAGILMFCLAIAADVAGFVIIRKVLDIEI